jgi:TetR/AcrR family transcriptional repressor of lmrAB and yxaGH operons
MAASMLELIQRQGYSGTGLNTVVQHSGAPKGSLYFHFPDGKEALGEKAVELAAGQFAALLAESAPEPPGVAVRRAIDVLAQMLEESGFELGCPVSVVTLEMGAHSERLRAACADAFAAWIEPLTARLVGDGRGEDDARKLATAIVCMVEGAVIVSRAQRSTEPLTSAAAAIDVLVTA